MKIFNSSLKLNNINFQKRLCAKSNVLKAGQKTPCKIYELDPYNEEDLSYFKPLYGTDDFRKYTFFDDIESDLIAALDSRFYTLEDEQGRCLGACEINENYSNNTDELVFLETAATCAHDNLNRDIKYVGETLLRFAVGVSKMENKKEFVVMDPTPSAYMFYVKQGFRESLYDESLYVKTKDCGDIIAKNTAHVGKMDYFI